MGIAIKLILALTLCAHCHQDDNYSDEQGNSRCDTFEIGIFGTFIERQANTSILQYDYFKIRCRGFSDRSEKIVLTRDGEILSKNGSDFTFWQTNDPDIHKSVYTCTDPLTGCESPHIVTIVPAIYLKSPDFVFSPKITDYTVDYGNPMTVLCSGPNATRLALTKDGEQSLTEQENKTTIKLFLEKPDLKMYTFSCTDLESTINNSVQVKVVPNMYAQSRNETLTPEYYKVYYKYYEATYGDSIQIYCVGPTAERLMVYNTNGQYFETETVNNWTVNLQREVLGELDFRCSHSNYTDSVSYLLIMVKPRIEVISRNIHRTENNAVDYTVKYGDTLEILCSGPDASKLLINNIRNYKGDIETINKTTIKYIVKEVYMDQTTSYYCRAESKYSTYVEVKIGVLPPDVADFGCVAYEGKYINCSWTFPVYHDNYTLSYLKYNKRIPICMQLRSLRKSTFCVWDYEIIEEEIDANYFDMLLEYCNEVGCSNQTYHFDRLYIVKLSPPERLKVLNITSRRAVFQWDTDHDLECDHKVQYLFNGLVQLVNSSLIKCEYKMKKHRGIYSGYYLCETELILPCPGQLYEVRVYQKLKEVGEHLWSDPGTATFHTMFDNNADTMHEDPKCWEPRKSADVMMHLTRELIKEVHFKMPHMKDEVSSLKKKRVFLEQYKKTGGI